MTDDWRRPYRSQDASGSPFAAGAVALAWIDECAKEAGNIYDRSDLEIDTFADHIGGGSMVLYAHQTPIAVATMFRDPMNFTVLIRWRAEDHAEMRSALQRFAVKADKWEAYLGWRAEARDATQIQHRLGDFRHARAVLNGKAPS